MKKLLVLFSLITIMANAQPAKVYVVLFTHIEDNLPIGVLGTTEARISYLSVRSKLIDMANLASSYSVRWSYQPDWKILLAAFIYEDSSVIATTNGKNILRYLKEDKGVIIDPHSHEKLGYNYTDVAWLLDSLGVGGSTVIGGHVWDPSLPQFQNWDRYRVPVRGTKYPWAIWRGNILMGSGTPNHTNDPQISGVWRPKDRYNYFKDDTLGNIYCIGQYKSDIASISELIALYDSGKVSNNKMLTSSYHIKPNVLTAINGITIIENTVIKPLVAMRDANKINITDFTTLINDWKTIYNSKPYIYDPNSPTKVDLAEEHNPKEFELYQSYPNPFNSQVNIGFNITRPGRVNISIFNLLGEKVAILIDKTLENVGYQKLQWNANNIPSGIYYVIMKYNESKQIKGMICLK
ncbi:MAG: T9SS type A sorting domain-containing protein [Ignavibacteria bacterium]|nr:T9SS type A sorting domain-containing protein [Ignavibacteria bacterium]